MSVDSALASGDSTIVGLSPGLDVAATGSIMEQLGAGRNDEGNVTWVSGVEIPWQYNVDFSAFYTWKQSEVKLSVYNATDQANWGSVNPIYGLDSIFAAEPIHLEGTLKIHF